MKNTRNLTTTTGLVVLSAFTSLMFAPVATQASVAGKRNTAIGLTAGAVYSAVKGKKTTAIVLGAGAAYAWKRHSDARKQQAYKRGYSRGHHYGYTQGVRRGRRMHAAHVSKAHYVKRASVHHVTPAKAHYVKRHI